MAHVASYTGYVPKLAGIGRAGGRDGDTKDFSLILKPIGKMLSKEIT